jgi:hypothetical protein
LRILVVFWSTLQWTYLLKILVFGKINHSHNLVLCQVVQTQLELCILPLCFKIVNNKFSQLGLQICNKFRWKGHSFIGALLHVSHLHHHVGLHEHFQIVSKVWTSHCWEPPPRDKIEISKYRTYYTPLKPNLWNSLFSYLGKKLNSHIALIPRTKMKYVHCLSFGVQNMQLMCIGHWHMELNVSFNSNIWTWCQQLHELNSQSCFTYHGFNASNGFKSISIEKYVSLIHEYKERNFSRKFWKAIWRTSQRTILKSILKNNWKKIYEN